MSTPRTPDATRPRSPHPRLRRRRHRGDVPTGQLHGYGTDDLIDEWMDAAQADPVDQRPRGWRAWRMRRAYRDLTVTAAIDRGTP